MSNDVTTTFVRTSRKRSLSSSSFTHFYKRSFSPTFTKYFSPLARKEGYLRGLLAFLGLCWSSNLFRHRMRDHSVAIESDDCMRHERDNVADAGEEMHQLPQRRKCNERGDSISESGETVPYQKLKMYIRFWNGSRDMSLSRGVSSRVNILKSKMVFKFSMEKHRLTQFCRGNNKLYGKFAMFSQCYVLASSLSFFNWRGTSHK